MLGALLLLAVVVIVVLVTRLNATPTASETARPLPSSSPAPATPAPAATAGATPIPSGSAAPGTPLPAECDELYSPEMVAAFDPLVLNPDWLDNPEEELRIGPADEQLRAVIEENDSLECIWTTAEGGSGAGVVTAVVSIDAAEQEFVAGRLAELDYSCFEQREGLRCVTETSTEEGTFGESHFLRDGIWLSTQYGNAGPEGYTLDMVDNLWPDD